MLSLGSGLLYGTCEDCGKLSPNFKTRTSVYEFFRGEIKRGCLWEKDQETQMCKTSCDTKLFLEDFYEYCPNCGKKIEVI